MRPRLLLSLTLLLMALLPAAAHAAVGIGIADNKSEMFSDPRYQALGIQYARIDLRWDVLSDAGATADLDTWMAGAQATGAHPLITFDRSPVRTSYNPTPAELVAAMNALRARYPGLTDFSAWNEANLSKKPALVARWYLALTRACPSCNILATDLVDQDNMVPWAKKFVKAAKRTPKIWGLHNYVDANRMTTKTTRKLLKAVGGNIWFTETGGIVSRHNKSKVKFPMSVPHAAQVTAFIFNKLAPLSPRIQRVYLYHWDTGLQGATTWDSGFVGPDDATRPSLDVLRSILARSARR